MKRDATALRAITHADEAIAKGDVILGMDAGQFADWKLAGIAREATLAEIARAKGEKPPAAKKAPSRKRKALTPLAKPVAPSPAESVNPE